MKAAADLVPLITHNKRVLTIPALRLVYDHCGLTGLQRLLNHKLRCIPWNASGRHRSLTSTRTPGISSAPSLADLQPLDLFVCPVQCQCVAWDRQDGVCWLPPLFFCTSSVPQLACLVSCFSHSVTHVLFSAPEPATSGC